MPNYSNNLFIGTSGWDYSDWKNIFYPQKLPDFEKLSFYSKFFNTVEINSTFYHFPRESSYKKWFLSVPDNFLFALKAPKLITHIKKLRKIKTVLKQFLDGAFLLEEKLGPILFQFPPSFKENNFEILESFIQKELLKLILAKKVKIAFEFRDKSWFQEKTYNLLKNYKICLTISDSSKFPKTEVLTSDFVYYRLHGPTILFASKYSKKEIENLAKKIKNWQRENRDIFVYFNNDVSGFAIENALELKKLLENGN
jgi:uncharacterized protein YecE (DUF72 family)